MSAKRSAGKKVGAKKKTGAKRVVAKKAARKTSRKPAAKKKTGAKRVVAKKAARKPAARKRAVKRSALASSRAKLAKKPAAKKAAPKKAAAKKAAPKKLAPKRVAPAKPVAKKAPPPPANRVRRDPTGHLDPDYSRGLRSGSGKDEGKPESGFLDRASSGDALAEQLGEVFVETALSGEDEGQDVAGEDVAEETGGPFVMTTGKTEFAYGTDESNPKRSKREPFPRT